MLGEAKLAQDMAAKLYEQGIYVTGFFFPVVPQGQGPHPHADVGRAFGADIDAAIAAFTDGRQGTGSDLTCAHWSRRRRPKASSCATSPCPQIGPDDILIKVAKTGICGTDLHIWKWDEWAQKTIPVPDGGRP